MPISPQLASTLAWSLAAAMRELDDVPGLLDRGQWRTSESVISRTVLELQRIAGELRTNAR